MTMMMNHHNSKADRHKHNKKHHGRVPSCPSCRWSLRRIFCWSIFGYYLLFFGWSLTFAWLNLGSFLPVIVVPDEELPLGGTTQQQEGMLMRMNGGTHEYDNKKGSSNDSDWPRTSVVVAVFSPLHFQTVFDSLQNLQQCDEARGIVDDVFLVWNSPIPPPPLTVVNDKETFASSLFQPLFLKGALPRVHVLEQKFNSLNNRYIATALLIRSPTALFLDDDMLVSCGAWVQIISAGTPFAANGSFVGLELTTNYATITAPHSTHRGEENDDSNHKEDADRSNHTIIGMTQPNEEEDTSLSFLSNTKLEEHHKLKCMEYVNSSSNIVANKKQKRLVEIHDAPSLPTRKKVMLVPTPSLSHYAQLPQSILAHVDEHYYRGHCDDILLNAIVLSSSSMGNNNDAQRRVKHPKKVRLHLDGDVLASCEHGSHDEEYAGAREECNKWLHESLFSTLSFSNQREKVDISMDCFYAANNDSSSPASMLRRGLDKILQCRSILDTTCPADADTTMRPVTYESVPGDLPKAFKDFDRTNEFSTKGVIGPLRTSLSMQEIREAFDAIEEYKAKVRKRLKEKKRSKDEADSARQLYGDFDVLLERCYAFDVRCRRLAEDKAIVEAVREVIGNDIVVYSMDQFLKKSNDIQPWHTDIEPYDRCYGKSVQIWLAVENVTPQSTLQIVTGSHRMPSVTWLFPEHVLRATTVNEKHDHEKQHVQSCATSIDPTAEIRSPVTKDGEFMLFHSNLWHASENTSRLQRKAIRVTFSHPECQVAGVFKYRRPDLPPLKDPIPAIPPVLLVSGQGRTFPEYNRLVNNFLHIADIPEIVRNKDRSRRKQEFGKSPMTNSVQMWTAEDMTTKMRKRKMRDSITNQQIIRFKADLLRGHSALFETLEVSHVHLSPFECAHRPESHLEPTVGIISNGSVGVLTVSNATVLPPTDHQLGRVPTATLLPPSGIFMYDSNVIHTECAGSAGGSFINIKYIPIKVLQSISARLRLFMPPAEDKTFLDVSNIMLFSRVFGKICRCIHNPHPDDDHEVFLLVEDVPPNVTLFALPEQKPLPVGTLLFYPLHSTHGIEARRDDTGEVIPYRKPGLQFDAIPRCLVLEFWAPDGTKQGRKMRKRGRNKK